MSRRRRHVWTVDEMILLEELWPTHTGAEIAERICGTRAAANAVWRMAGVIGIRKWPHWPREVLERVRELHAEGLADGAIARRMPDVFTGPDGRRQAAAVRLYRLKLPMNLEAVKALKRKAVESQRRTLGIRHGGDLRALGYRKFAIENGWPEDCRPREVQILNVLARGVPMTMLEIATAIGMPTEPTFASGKRRILLAGNGPGGTYTASLARRGLVMRLMRAGPRDGPAKKRNLDLYCLGPAALSLLQERARCLSNETPSASTTPAS